MKQRIWHLTTPNGKTLHVGLKEAVEEKHRQGDPRPYHLEAFEECSTHGTDFQCPPFIQVQP